MSAKIVIACVALMAAGLLAGPASAREPSIDEVYQAAEAGRFGQAQQMMDEVLLAHPNSAKAHFVEAELLARQGKTSGARSELQTAERLEPGLPFAKPQAVQELQRRIGSSPGIPGVAGGGIPWNGLLLGGALVVLAFVVFGALRRRPAPAGPVAGGMPYGAPGTAAQPYGPGTPPAAPPAGGGIGSGIIGGLATGAALGAGLVAGEALAHRLGGSSHPDAGSAGAWGDDAGPRGGDMGGNDFGLSDTSSWDDSSGGGDVGGGSDWN